MTSYTDPSTYTVTGTAVNGCTNSAQSVATVITPSNNLTVSSSATICIGNSITLTAAGSPGYTWTPCTTGCNSSTISVSPTVTTTYTVSGLNNCGIVITKTVQVVVTPPYVITATAQPNTICAGSSSTLTATSAGHVTYQWIPLFVNGSPVVVTPTVTTTYTVYSIVPNCGMAQAVVTISVNPVPLTANLNPSSNFVCAGTNATLTANVSPAGTYTYNWA
ncbi:gliding motility protein, partial [Patescibacteria group bacterium]